VILDWNIWIYLLTAFSSIFIISKAGESGFLNSGLKRGVGGSTLQVGSSYYLISYTNFSSFIKASLDGNLGLPGYMFIISISILVVVFAFNLYKYKVAIR
jgi:hypothetical protein